MSIVDDGSWLVEEEVEVKGERLKVKGEKEEVKGERLQAKGGKGHGPRTKGPWTKYQEQAQTVRIVIDRITKNGEDETISRLGDSIQTAFFEGKGDCYVRYRLPEASPKPSPQERALISDEQEHFFCDRFELDGIRFEEPTPNFFSFNNPYGGRRNADARAMAR